MEKWEIDFKWLEVKHFIKDQMALDKLPDLNAVLFLIGLQELGRLDGKFTKEQKQDLMHIAICHLLSFDGYYAFKGRDGDGWPHYELLKPVQEKGVAMQEEFLKEKVILYFKEWKDAEAVSD